MLKRLIFGSLAVLLAVVAAAALWFHSRMPPNCTDPRTIALVRHSLLADHHLPATVTVSDIRTMAGGWIALRFVCQASVNGVGPHDLPPGTPLPGLVNYTSQLTPDRTRHEVTVDLEPLLKWEQVQ